jgi:hypothetical protein
MKKFWIGLVLVLTLVLEPLAGTTSGRSGAAPASADEAPIVSASGSRLTVYYPGQHKIFVYSELGGNCVFAYTISTPGGPVARENCK